MVGNRLNQTRKIGKVLANKTTEANKEEKGTNYKRKKDNSEIERQSEDEMEVEDVAITE